MRNLGLSVLTLGMVCLFTACGSSNNGNVAGQPGPLSSDQKTTVFNTMGSMGHAQNAAGTLKNGERRLTLASEVSSPDSSDEARERAMASHLTREVCQVKMLPDPQDYQNYDPSHQLFQISGKDCPISFLMESTMTMGSDSMTMNSTLDYQVQGTDQEFKKMNDVNSFHLEGADALTGSNGQISATHSGKGVIRSQQNGEIPVQITGSGQGDSNGTKLHDEVTWTLQFPKFVSTLKMVMDQQNGKKTSTYFINGEQMSDQDVQKYLSSSMGASKSSSNRRGTKALSLIGLE